MRQVVRVSMRPGRNGGGVVCERCELATSSWARMRGLIGRRALDRQQGMMLRPAFAIHTLFMRFPIDAVFVDSDLRVVGIRSRLRPWRMAAVRGASAVLELAPGEAERRGVAVRQRFRLEAAGGGR